MAPQMHDFSNSGVGRSRLVIRINSCTPRKSELDGNDVFDCKVLFLRLTQHVSRNGVYTIGSKG